MAGVSAWLLSSFLVQRFILGDVPQCLEKAQFRPRVPQWLVKCWLDPVLVGPSAGISSAQCDMTSL